MGFLDFLKRESPQERYIKEAEEQRRRLELEKKIAKYKGQPLRLPIQDVYKIMGVGLVPVGRIESGVLYVGQEVIVMPSGVQTKVKMIEAHHQSLQQAVLGDNVGFSLENISKGDVGTGYVVGDVEHPPTVASKIRARVTFLHDFEMHPGLSSKLFCHTVRVDCVFEDCGSEAMMKGQSREYTISFKHPICIEKASEFENLGKFALRDKGLTFAWGEVLDISK